MGLWPANVFTHIGSVDGVQINDFAPAELNLASASRLREVVIGTRGNRVGETINAELVTGLSFGNMPLLEKLYAANLTKIN
jgi:hypothetical protein